MPWAILKKIHHLILKESWRKKAYEIQRIKNLTCLDSQEEIHISHLRWCLISLYLTINVKRNVFITNALIPIIFAPNAWQSLMLHWDYLLFHYYKCRDVISSQYIRSWGLLAHTDMAKNKPHLNILQFTKLWMMLLRVVWTVKLNCVTGMSLILSCSGKLVPELVDIMLLNDQVQLSKLIQVVLTTTHLA